MIAAWAEDMLKEYAGGEAEPRVFTVRCKNGEDKTIQFRPVSMKNGKKLFTYQDITESARMEASLRESEQKYIQLYDESKRLEELYRSLLHSSPDAVFIYDIEGHALLTSGTFKYEDLLFKSQRGEVLTVPSVNRVVKGWCREINLKGNYGAHTLRKTWGYHQRVSLGTGLPKLMVCSNHSSQRQTLDYLCVQPEKIKRVYENQL